MTMCPFQHAAILYSREEQREYNNSKIAEFEMINTNNSLTAYAVIYELVT